MVGVVQEPAAEDLAINCNVHFCVNMLANHAQKSAKDPFIALW